MTLMQRRKAGIPLGKGTEWFKRSDSASVFFVITVELLLIPIFELDGKPHSRPNFFTIWDRKPKMGFLLLFQAKTIINT